MSKVLTFSRTYPAYHPKKGQPTNFIEKIWLSLISEGIISTSKAIELSKNTGIGDFTMNNIRSIDLLLKNHTIRAGQRFKVGDKFSPRVWSGKPYQSKQIIIAPDIEVKKTWDFESVSDGTFLLNGKYVDVTSSNIPENDGLNTDDFLDWFPVGKEFKGQIICWNENIEY